MYAKYVGIDNYKGLRKNLVYEIEFKESLDRMIVEVTLHRKYMTTIEYYGLGSFTSSWEDV